VVAAAIALRLARSVPVVLADLAGDLPLVLGLEMDPEKPGLADWLAAGPGVSDDALDRVTVPIGPRLSIMPRGPAASAAADRSFVNGTGAALAEALGRRGTVVVDCGAITPDSPSWTVAAEAEQSLLVMRTCYIALRRAMALPLRPSGVVLLEEVGRMVDQQSVEEALGVPVVARIDWDQSIGKAVDIGLLSCRFPSKLRRVARAAA